MSTESDDKVKVEVDGKYVEESVVEEIIMRTVRIREERFQLIEARLHEAEEQLKALNARMHALEAPNLTSLLGLKQEETK